MSDELHDRANGLAIKCASKLHSRLIDGRYYHVSEQFEEVEELIIAEMKQDAERIESLEKEIARLKEALAFYEDDMNWNPFPFKGQEQKDMTPATTDRGRRAKLALNGINNKKLPSDQLKISFPSQTG